jgi:dipeptidyl aminopeptidase/acylaminoacyl peptidase
MTVGNKTYRYQVYVPADHASNKIAQRIRLLPIRIFHGDADETVPVKQSRRLLPALKAVNSDVG